MSAPPGRPDPTALAANEFDGYLDIVPISKADVGAMPIHLPWQVLPRHAAEVEPAREHLQISTGADSIPLENEGVVQNDTYLLLALSPDLPRGARGAMSPTSDSFCTSRFLWAFAINTWERQTRLMPVSHQVWMDVDRDGNPDYVLLNRDLSFDDVSDGRQVSWVFDLATGDASGFFFAEHATNTANAALFMCGEQIGFDETDILNTQVDAFVVAEDFYYGGPGDLVDGLTVTSLGERYFGSAPDLAPGQSGALSVTDFGLFPGNSEELGVMVYTNGDRGSVAHGGATAESEALLFTLPGVDEPERSGDERDEHS